MSRPPEHTSFADLLAQEARGTSPPAETGEDNPIIRWAEAYREVSDNEPYRVDLCPPFRGIYDAVTDFTGDAKVVALCKACQIGATEFMVNTICWAIAELRAPILALMETEDKVKTIMRERLAPMFSRPPLEGLLKAELEKGARGSMYEATYAGNSLKIYGSNAATSYSSVTARFVLLDEFARFPNDVRGEGDPVSLMRRRMATFNERGKLLIVSTPTDPYMMPGSFSSIVDRGDRRVYKMPCVHCGVPYDWTMEPGRETFKYKVLDNGGLRVWQECPSCRGETFEADKPGMMAAGAWEATKDRLPGDDVISFMLPAWYSPKMTWTEIARNALAVDRNLETRRTLFNTIYGLPYDEGIAAPKPEDAKARFSLDYVRGTIPRPVKFLTIAVDCQKGWMKYSVIGWGRRTTSFLIDYGKIDLSIDSEGGKNELRRLFNSRWACEGGGSMGVAIACVDAAFLPTPVFDLVASFPQPVQWQGHTGHWTLQGYPCVFPVRGTGVDGQVRVLHRLGDSQRVSRTGRQIRVVWAGSTIAKMELHRAMNQPADFDPEDIEGTAQVGTAFFPMDAEMEYFEEIAAEEMQLIRSKKSGKVKMDFMPIRDRNEALDCWVYARAAAEIAGVGRQEEQVLENLYMRTFRADVDAGMGTSEAEAQQWGGTFTDAMAQAAAAREDKGAAVPAAAPGAGTFTAALEKARAARAGESAGRKGGLYDDGGSDLYGTGSKRDIYKEQ